METRKSKLTRREMLRVAGLAAAGAVVAACGGAPAATPTARIVEVTKVVDRPVTQVVEKQVTQVVEKQVTQVIQVTPVAKAPVKLTIWTHWGGTREPLLKKAFDDFTARNPLITVSPTLTSYDREEETITTAFAAGLAPDVLMLNASVMPPYVMNKMLLTVDDLVAQAGIKGDQVYDSDWQSSFYNGKQWGLPQTVGGSACLLFINKKAFTTAGLDPDKPPTTWAELLAAAKKLVVKDGNNIKQLGIAPPITATWWLNYLAENDSSWLSDDGRTVQMNNPGAVEALQFITDLTDSQGGAEAVAAFTTAGGDADPFMSGRVSMLLDGVWRYFMIQTSAPDMQYT